MSSGRRILLVEDDPNLRRVLSYHLEREGYSVEQAPDGTAGLAAFQSVPVDLVITDVRMPGMDGIELLRTLRERDRETPVVVMTAYGTIGDAVEAMQAGAADYLTKPVERETLLLAVRKAIRLRELARENRRLKETLRERKPVEMMVGTSRAFQELMATVRKVAPTDATVLITGESGTGKELVARAIHSLSQRATGPFVAINCAAVPGDLLESELFGHEKGAFTGALEAKPGKFLLAHGGTLLLDEIGDMNLALQAKILRAIQERVVDPVGSRSPRPVDVRVLASTNRNLQEGVKNGEFREDLFWRLNVIPVAVPPLREREEDVSLLFRHFYRHYGGDAELLPEAEALLTGYPWPGNVRELQNVCQRLAVLHPGRAVTPNLLPPEIGSPDGQPAFDGGGLWAIEREAILRALREHGGNRSAAARALKVPRHVLLYRMKKFGIQQG